MTDFMGLIRWAIENGIEIRVWQPSEFNGYDRYKMVEVQFTHHDKHVRIRGGDLEDVIKRVGFQKKMIFADLCMKEPA